MAVVYKAWSLMSDGDLSSLPPKPYTYVHTHTSYPCLQESETRLGGHHAQDKLRTFLISRLFLSQCMQTVIKCTYYVATA